MTDSTIPASIFRAYDIRGIVGRTLTADIARLIGLGIGTEAAARGEQEIVVGRDGRDSSPELSSALIAGLRSSGRDVVDIGIVPTPLLYFATHWLPADSGVMVTGSHNGPEYNGMKLIIAGKTLYGEDLQAIYRRIVAGDFTRGRGELSSSDVKNDYVARVAGDISTVAQGAALKIIIDCGNGVAGVIAPQLFRSLGHQVEEMYCEVDGAFPNHHPDPSQPENLEALIARVTAQGADIGLAFDGDGDRLGVVDSAGHIIWPDRQLMVLAKDVLSRNRGAAIIYDVKCSRYLKTVIEANGGVPLMWKTGHSLIKSKNGGNAGPPRRGTERSYLFQGTLVRVRRRHLCRRAAAGNPGAQRTQLGSPVCRYAGGRFNAGTAGQVAGGFTPSLYGEAPGQRRFPGRADHRYGWRKGGIPGRLGPGARVQYLPGAYPAL